MAQYQNKLCRNSNLLWEGSRIILPEHREAMNEQLRTQDKRSKPELDDQEKILINDMLLFAYQAKQTVSLTLFDEFNEEVRDGIIKRLTPGKITLEHEDEMTTILIDRILKIRISE